MNNRNNIEKSTRAINKHERVIKSACHIPGSFISEREIVLERLKKVPLTKLQAMDELGIYTLAQRIHELRKIGYDIRSEIVPIETVHGLRQIAEYTLISEGVGHA